MRKWLQHADGDDIKTVLSGGIAVMALCAFVLVWFLETSAPECGGNCSTEFSSVNR
jgi:hypothetical protein